MSVSSGAANLFASVAVAIGCAFAGAWALKNPDDVHAAAGLFLPPDMLASRPKPLARPNPLDAAKPKPRGGDVTLRAGDHGHFEAQAEINGRAVGVLVDTGATMVALTYEDAERAGIYLSPSDFTHQVGTANGIAKVAPISIDVIRIGSISVRNVPGAVTERGKLQQTLLGMSFLGRLSRVDMRSNTLELHQ